LHVVVRGTPGITVDWLNQTLSALDDGTSIRAFEAVYDLEGLSTYLTKHIANKSIADGWPRYFRPVTFTHEW
jgi:hypothetical protein